ncbi:nuclear transport factor 2 family protein [Nocardia sp. NPDC060256]|uniref:nuclear transport factor 2 family protein n=1 Tax=unclassified Nocardia TaxID=2637762 RepID=UPI003651E038
MTDSIENLITAHLNAWNAPAGPDRDKAVSEVYAPDVFIVEPDNAHRGHHGMTEAISGLQAQAPGTTITRTGSTQTAQDLVTYSWTLGVDGQPAIASGRDVLIVRDGKITSLYVLIDDP